MKANKILLTACVCLLSLTALASSRGTSDVGSAQFQAATFAGYKQVDPADAPAYSAALQRGIDGLQIDSKCMTKQIIQNAEGFYLQENSNQPLLIALLRDQRTRTVATAIFTTDSEFQKITSIREAKTVLSYETELEGDLRTPKLSGHTVSTDTDVICYKR